VVYDSESLCTKAYSVIYDSGSVPQITFSPLVLPLANLTGGLHLKEHTHPPRHIPCACVWGPRGVLGTGGGGEEGGFPVRPTNPEAVISVRAHSGENLFRSIDSLIFGNKRCNTILSH